MRKIIFFLTMTTVIGIATISFAEEKGSTHEMKGSAHEMKGSTSDTNMDEMMDKMMEYSTPGEEHAILNSLVGKWTHTVTHWMSPDSEAEQSEGTSETKWIMDGRFIQQEAKGNWNGMPFNGLGIIGYDKISKEYNSLWLDNMGTGIMKGQGTYDAATKTITESGSFSCPMTGTVREHSTKIKIKDNNNYSYETYMTDPASGQKFKAMVIDYTRVVN